MISWAQMEMGMNEPSVRRLLGEPESDVRSPVDPPGHYWEYGWASPLRNEDTGYEPSENAYVVFFGTNDRVVSWRAPAELPE